jgi:hypothetical protein
MSAEIEKARAAVTLSVSLLRRVKARCALEGTTLSDLVDRLLREWLDPGKVKK